MISFKNYLIIIGSTLPYDYPTDYIRQTAKILSQKNKVIIFLWGNALSLKESVIEIFKGHSLSSFLQKRERILLFTPLHFLPFRRFTIIQKANLFINVILLKIFIHLKRWEKLPKILWIFNYELYLLPKFFGKDYLSLYDCVEYFSSLDKKLNRKIKTKEKQLINNVDLFFVDSPTLSKIFKKYSPKVVPQGFDLTTFKKYAHKKIRLPSLPKNRPSIGYVGSINYRLDYKLLINLAKNKTEWNFVFVGQIQKIPLEDKFINTAYWQKNLFSLKNVFYIKNQPKFKLPKIIAQFDICIIPYNTKIKFNLYSRAMKMYEYFYMGKPIVSTPIEETKYFKPYVKIANNCQEWQKRITFLIQKEWPDRYRQMQKIIAKKNSWDKKIEVMGKIIEKCS